MGLAWRNWPIELPIERSRFPYVIGARKVEITNVAVLVKIETEYTDDHGPSKLVANIISPTQPATSIGLKQWIGQLQRGTWEGKDDFAKPASPGQTNPCAWRLEVQRSAGGGQPINPRALTDVIVLVTYRFAKG